MGAGRSGAPRGPHAPSDLLDDERPAIRHETEIAGARTAWWEWPAIRPASAVRTASATGPDDVSGAADAPTIVLVHGFRGTHLGLAPLVAQMPEARFLAPDLPGFGESGAMPREHDLDGYAAWLEALLAELDPAGEAIVLGHSFGSLVVSRRATGLGARRIILVNPIAENALEGPERVLTGLAILYYRVGALLPEPLGRAILASPLITRVMSEVMATTRNPALRRWIHAQHDAWFSAFSDRDRLLEAFRASVSDSVLAHAAELPEGVLLVAGERDSIAPLPAQRRLQAAMRGATLEVIGGVGHLIHYETPVALARAIRRFLA